MREQGGTPSSAYISTAFVGAGGLPQREAHCFHVGVSWLQGIKKRKFRHPASDQRFNLDKLFFRRRRSLEAEIPIQKNAIHDFLFGVVSE